MHKMAVRYEDHITLKVLVLPCIVKGSSVPDTKSGHVPHTTQGSTTNEKEPQPGSKCIVQGQIARGNVQGPSCGSEQLQGRA